MKDFTYIDDYGLRAHACTWLKNMGLNETRWILDAEWFDYHAKPITFKEWIKNK